jgi:multimeric flavodoxin WrbA
METIILDGARSGDLKVDEVSEVLASTLQKLGQVDVFKLREIKIADCMGCFGCWIKTPGECVIDDAERVLAKKLAHADLRVFLTPVVFGGYSYELKKALDRQIGNILPFFTKNEQGEIHHARRYETKGRLIGVGVLSKPDVESEAIFKALVTRNALNMQPQAYSSGIIYINDNTEMVNRKIKEMLVEVGLKDGFA